MARAHSRRDSTRRTLLSPDAIAKADAIAQSFDNFINAVEERLGAFAQAHNDLDRRFEDLHYKLLFVMQRITVKRPLANRSPIVGSPQFEEGTLFDFWGSDGPTFVHALKKEADALIREYEAAKAKALADTRDTLPATTLSDVEGLAVSRTKH